MATAELGLEYIEDFMEKESFQQENNDNDFVDEEKVTVEEVNLEEATPCFMEDLKPTTPLGIDGMEFRQAVERQLSESCKINTIDVDVDSNKVMIHDLKSSVVSLKVSTSRIEREVKDLSEKVITFNSEKKTLDNSLIDLEFRFNELVTHESEHDEMVHTKPQSHVQEVEEEIKTLDLQNQFKNVVEKLEGQVRQMDEKIKVIDKQNEKVRCLSQEIEKHEKMVTEIRRMLSHQEKELNKISEFREEPAPQPIITNLSLTPNTISMQNTMNEFIAKTELNERSIATAWVGLVGALLLIPIAWIMGKFF